MFVFLSKFLPPFIYPLGLVVLLVAAALLLRKHPGWQRAVLIGALAVLFLGGNRWVSYSLTKNLEWKHLPPAEMPNAEVIVLLGGGTEPPEPPRPMVELNGAGDRIVYAAYLYQQGKAERILISGGTTWMTGQTSNPAADMGALLDLLGVPEERLLLQGRSQNTYEDALYSCEMLKAMGVQRILLVTSASHMPRALALFEKQGMEVIPAPVDFKVTQKGWDDLHNGSIANRLIYLMPNASDLGLTTNSLKEYIGMWVYRLRGWL